MLNGHTVILVDVLQDVVVCLLCQQILEMLHLNFGVLAVTVTAHVHVTDVIIQNHQEAVLTQASTYRPMLDARTECVPQEFIDA